MTVRGSLHLPTMKTIYHSGNGTDFLFSVCYCFFIDAYTDIMYIRKMVRI